MQTTQSYNRMNKIFGEPVDGFWQVAFSDGSTATIECPAGAEMGDWEKLEYSLREWDVTGNIERVNLVANNHWNLYEVDGFQEVIIDIADAFSDGLEYARKQISSGRSPLQVGRELFASMDDVLDSFDGFGASDSEPRNYLTTSINRELDVVLN